MNFLNQDFGSLPFQNPSLQSTFLATTSNQYPLSYSTHHVHHMEGGDMNNYATDLGNWQFTEQDPQTYEVLSNQEFEDLFRVTIHGGNSTFVEHQNVSEQRQLLPAVAVHHSQSVLETPYPNQINSTELSYPQFQLQPQTQLFTQGELQVEAWAPSTLEIATYAPYYPNVVLTDSVRNFDVSSSNSACENFFFSNNSNIEELPCSTAMPESENNLQTQNRETTTAPLNELFNWLFMDTEAHIANGNYHNLPRETYVQFDSSEYSQGCFGPQDPIANFCNPDLDISNWPPNLGSSLDTNTNSFLTTSGRSTRASPEFNFLSDDSDDNDDNDDSDDNDETDETDETDDDEDGEDDDDDDGDDDDDEEDEEDYEDYYNDYNGYKDDDDDDDEEDEDDEYDDEDCVEIDEDDYRLTSHQLQQSSVSLARENEGSGRQGATAMSSPKIMQDFSAVSLLPEEPLVLNPNQREAISISENAGYQQFIATSNDWVPMACTTAGSCGSSEDDHTHYTTDSSSDSFADGNEDTSTCPSTKKKHFDYSNVKVEHTIVLAPELQNRAKESRLTDLSKQHRSTEFPYRAEIQINRTRYHRGNLDALNNLHPNLMYIKTRFFAVTYPYRQEFTRVELDPETGETINDTRSALCAYCPNLTFHELKNSAYAQHMSQQHGIYTDGYLAPNPLWHGMYKVSKEETPTRTTSPRLRVNEAIVCPACYDVVEISGSSARSKKRRTPSTKKNPLLMYFRHFKVKHRVNKRAETYFKEFE
ncbi:hypothetical protein JCM33374_g5476 [Metschnikowia sp. JCM 33374]|nr:hypothetical protein JCM33374_g5476 [Metschnikowia sp. JCM 33374]